LGGWSTGAPSHAPTNKQQAGGQSSRQTSSGRGERRADIPANFFTIFYNTRAASVAVNVLTGNLARIALDDHIDLTDTLRTHDRMRSTHDRWLFAPRTG
jgi:hypothetical protein